MSKLSTLFTLALTAGLLGTASVTKAQLGITAQPKPDFLNMPAPTVQPKYTPTPLKAPVAKAPSTTRTYDILVDEDFSLMTKGTPAVPDTTEMLANAFGEPGIFMNPALTKDGTWAGNMAYQAGGMLYLKTPNPYVQAFAATPLGDYSGDLIISCKVKAVNCWVITGYDEQQNPIWNYWTGSTFGVAVLKGGFDKTAEAECDGSCYTTVRCYAEQGWTRVEFRVSNYSSDNDSYVKFYTQEAVLIDDVKIEVEPTFMAVPSNVRITDFQKDQFSLAWDPVRKAYSYVVDLYTKEYTSEEGEHFTADFEEGGVSEPWQSTSTEISESEGADGSKALVLRNGQSLTFPTNGAGYMNGKVWMYLVDPTVDKNEPYWQYYVNGAVTVEAYSDNNGWKNLGHWDGYKICQPVTATLEREITNLNDYSCIRLTASGIGDEAYVLIDNAEVETDRTSDFVMVEGESAITTKEPGWEDYWSYDFTDYCNYTFTNLDPETEYYYSVRCHFQSMFCKRHIVHALGVSAPEAQLATDIDARGSFTANWEAAPKATGYAVNLYGATKAEADQADFTIIEEGFDKINAEMTSATSVDEPENLGNSGTTALDDATYLPGWTGSSNTMVQGMLGCQSSSYSKNHITTPTIYLANSNPVTLTLVAYGEAGDALGVNINGVEYAINLETVDETHGLMSGKVENLPVSGNTLQIKFTSQNSKPFLIDYFRISQDVQKGDVVRSWLQTAETGKDELSYTFSNLSDWEFPLFAYDVISQFVYSEREQTVSQPSGLILVDLDQENSFSGISSHPTDVAGYTASGAEAERFTIDGRRADKGQKGLIIVRQADGSVRKMIVK